MEIGLETAKRLALEVALEGFKREKKPELVVTSTSEVQGGWFISWNIQGQTRLAPGMSSIGVARNGKVITFSSSPSYADRWNEVLAVANESAMRFALWELTETLKRFFSGNRYKFYRVHSPLKRKSEQEGGPTDNP